MSFWTFSDVFEENGPFREPLNGGFGLVGVEGIKKPSFYAFSLLHKLGDKRLANTSEHVIVTRRADQAVVVAVWSLSPPDKAASARILDLEFRGFPKNQRVLISRVDETNGNARAAYAEIGKPRYPTQKQVAKMDRETALKPAETVSLENGHLKLTIPVNGLAVVEIGD